LTQLDGIKLTRRAFGKGVAAAAAVGAGLATARPTVAAAATRSPYYGVAFSYGNLDPRTTTTLENLAPLGIGGARIGFCWAQVEAIQGQFTWSGYDALVTKMYNLGLAIHGQITFTTTWNTTGPASLGPAQQEHYPPADDNSWSQWVTMLVKRYKGAVRTWELWNEPDLLPFWPGTPSQYAQLLAVTYSAVKSADPTARFATGGLALAGDPSYYNPNFLQQILTDPNYPATPNFDVVSFHTYGALTETRNKVSYIRTQLANHGVSNRQLWVTEIGYPSDATVQPESGYQNGPQSQAQWLTDMLPQVRQLGVSHLLWFDGYDMVASSSTNPPDLFSTDGLYDSNLNPRPAVSALQSLIASGR